jgi:hypothetical protein
VLAVAVLVLFVVAVGLAVLLVRTNGRVLALTEQLGEADRAREEAEVARRAAEALAAEADQARDDALERANRARRDAADVAKRLKQESDARTAAEGALAEAEAAASGGDEQAAELWDLALGAVRRTWEVSVAPSPGLTSPLDGTEDELQAAIGIEVDAAREEAGAAIELAWSGSAVAPPALAVRALALAQEVIGRLAKATESVVLAVTTAPGRVTLEVTGTDADGAPAPVDALLAGVAPEHQVAPGRFELEGPKG